MLIHDNDFGLSYNLLLLRSEVPRRSTWIFHLVFIERVLFIPDKFRHRDVHEFHFPGTEKVPGTGERRGEGLAHRTAHSTQKGHGRDVDASRLHAWSLLLQRWCKVDTL